MNMRISCNFWRKNDLHATNSPISPNLDTNVSIISDTGIIVKSLVFDSEATAIPKKDVGHNRKTFVIIM